MCTVRFRNGRVVGNLTPEQEIVAAHVTATTAAFQVLVLLLQREGILERGEFPTALADYMELSKTRLPDTVLALLDDLRQALLD